MVPKELPGLRRVLVTEDDLVLMRFYRQALASICKEAVVVSSKEEAIRELERGAVDLLIADLQLPEEDGVAVVRQAISTQPHLPILIASGYVADERYRAEMDSLSNIKGYLEKPFTVDQLFQKIREIIGSDDTHPSR